MRPNGVAAIVLVALVTIAQPLLAWTDARPAGLVTELAVDRDGGATVTLRIRWRVLAGRFRVFDLVELPADFALLEAIGSDATGNAVPVATRIPSPGRLELTLGEEGGVRRGAIDVVVRYTTSLRAQGAIRRIGADAVVELTTVPWERGLEATEIRVALPASVRRAQWLADETPGVDATVTSELGRDVVHAIRRHVPAGARWTARIACDPTLFAWLDRPQAVAHVVRHTDTKPLRPVLILAVLLALALGGTASLLARRNLGKSFVQLPIAPRALPIALASLGGVIQALALRNVNGAVTAGTIVASIGLALLVPRNATLARSDRGTPARMWPEDRVLATASSRLGTRSWPRIAAALLVAISASVAALAVTRRGVLLGLTAVDLAMASMAALATLRVLTPRPDVTVLRALVKSLGSALPGSGARLAWWVRGDGVLPGSVRLRVVPRRGHRHARGVRSIECVVCWDAGTLAWHPTVVLFVRVDQGSPLERTVRLAATRVGRLESDPERGQLALVVELVGPDRGRALRELRRVVSEAIVRVPAERTAKPTARDGMNAATGEALV